MRPLPDLLNACRDGESAALNELVRRFRHGALRQAGAALGDPAMAEDAVQNAFVVALTHLDTLRDPAAFAGWWRQVVRTCCTRLHRATRPTECDALEGLADPAPSPHERLENEQLRSQVRAALAQVPGVGRETAELFYLHELSCSQVADHLGVPPGTVKRRLHDARGHLRSMLLGQVAACATPSPPTHAPHLTRIPTLDTEHDR